MLILLIIVSLSSYLGTMQKEERRDSERVFRELGESEKKREELIGGESFRGVVDLIVTKDVKGQFEEEMQMVNTHKLGYQTSIRI